jgi:hypothetical protein
MSLGQLTPERTIGRLATGAAISPSERRIVVRPCEETLVPTSESLKNENGTLLKVRCSPSSPNKP